jgi:hypothetical protein
VSGTKSPPPSKPPKGGSKAKCFAYASGGGSTGGDTEAVADAGTISYLLESHLLCVTETQVQDIRKVFCDATLQEGINARSHAVRIAPVAGMCSCIPQCMRCCFIQLPWGKPWGVVEEPVSGTTSLNIQKQLFAQGSCVLPLHYMHYRRDAPVRAQVSSHAWGLLCYPKVSTVVCMHAAANSAAVICGGGSEASAEAAAKATATLFAQAVAKASVYCEASGDTSFYANANAYAVQTAEGWLTAYAEAVASAAVCDKCKAYAKSYGYVKEYVFLKAVASASAKVRPLIIA